MEGGEGEMGKREEGGRRLPSRGMGARGASENGRLDAGVLGPGAEAARDECMLRRCRAGGSARPSGPEPPLRGQAT